MQIERVERLKVKNWESFQHYKKRNPPWIKLHRSIFNDYEFQELPESCQYDLVRIWLLASSDCGFVPNNGKLVRSLCKLRHVPNINLLVKKGFLIPCVAETPAPLPSEKKEPKKLLAPKRRERPESSPGYSSAFLDFWKAYPRKDAKGAAWKAWKKLNPFVNTVELIMDSIDYHKQTFDWLKSNGQFIPMPATYLNQRRWEDEENELVSEEK